MDIIVTPHITCCNCCKVSSAVLRLMGVQLVCTAVIYMNVTRSVTELKVGYWQLTLLLFHFCSTLHQPCSLFWTHLPFSPSPRRQHTSSPSDKCLTSSGTLYIWSNLHSAQVHVSISRSPINVYTPGHHLIKSNSRALRRKDGPED